MTYMQENETGGASQQFRKQTAHSKSTDSRITKEEHRIAQVLADNTGLDFRAEVKVIDDGKPSEREAVTFTFTCPDETTTQQVHNGFSFLHTEHYFGIRFEGNDFSIVHRNVEQEEDPHQVMFCKNTFKNINQEVLQKQIPIRLFTNVVNLECREPFDSETYQVNDHPELTGTARQVCALLAEKTNLPFQPETRNFVPEFYRAPKDTLVAICACPTDTSKPLFNALMANKPLLAFHIDGDDIMFEIKIIGDDRYSGESNGPNFIKYLKQGLEEMDTELIHQATPPTLIAENPNGTRAGIVKDTFEITGRELDLCDLLVEKTGMDFKVERYNVRESDQKDAPIVTTNIILVCNCPEDQAENAAALLTNQTGMEFFAHGRDLFFSLRPYEDDGHSDEYNVALDDVVSRFEDIQMEESSHHIPEMA